jgi:hypothetical protein
LDRLQVRQISARFLSQDERVRIADLHQAGVGVRQIAVSLGRAPSTISRELTRNTVAGKRIGRSKPTAEPLRVALGITVGESPPISFCDSLCLSSLRSGGARSKSADISIQSFPTGRRCDYVTRASTG